MIINLFEEIKTTNYHYSWSRDNDAAANEEDIIYIRTNAYVCKSNSITYSSKSILLQFRLNSFKYSLVFLNSIKCVTIFFKLMNDKYYIKPATYCPRSANFNCVVYLYFHYYSVFCAISFVLIWYYQSQTRRAMDDKMIIMCE